MTKTQTEGRRSKPTIKENARLSFLIEDALERSEVVLAAESIVEKLQGIAEDLSTIEAKDIMPLFDSLNNAFGPQVAQKFNTVATEQIRQLVAAVQSAKGAMDQEILRLKQGVEGGEMNDMSMDAGGMTPPPEAPGAPMDAPGEPPLGGEGGLSEVPPGAPGDEMGADAGIPGSTGPAVGRPRKESAKPKGKPLAERKIKEDSLVAPTTPAAPQAASAEQPHSHESTYFIDNLNNLSMFHGGAGRLAHNVANMIRTGELSLDQRKSLANVLSTLAAFASEPSHWSGVDADTKLNMTMKQAGIWKVDSPAVERVVQGLKRLAHLLSLHHDRMLESNIRMLRTAADPDALVLKTFRTKLAEHRDGQMAAIRTARTFAIDVEDVVLVVREAAARRPFREARANKSPRLREADVTMQPAQLQAHDQQAQDRALGQDVPIFPVDQSGPVQAGVTPNPGTADTGVGSSNGLPPNQSASTQKPLNPMDMRLRKQQQTSQEAHREETKKQVQQQAQTPKPQQQMPQPPQQPQGQPRPAFKPPGEPMDQNNPALRRRVSR